MKLENDAFIIECDESIKYMREAINYFNRKKEEIMSFFELDSVKYKRKMKVWNDIEEYKKHIEKYTTYQDYMCADTFDGNINLLSIEEAHKTKEHSNMTIEEFMYVVCHEFVHICQQDSQIENINETCDWFWEALATNLGNPEDFSETVIEIEPEELTYFNDSGDNYQIAYTIGKYMLENYSHDQILQYVKYPTIILNNSKKIINEAKDWSQNKKSLSK